MRNFYDWVALIGAILVVVVVINQRLYDPKNWFDEVTDEWDYNLEDGTLRLYRNNRSVATLTGVTEAQVGDLVEELIHDYEVNH